MVRPGNIHTSNIIQTTLKIHVIIIREKETMNGKEWEGLHRKVQRETRE